MILPPLLALVQPQGDACSMATPAACTDRQTIYDLGAPFKRALAVA